MCTIVLPNLENLKDYVPPPRPVPCLGYVGLCKTLGETKPLKNRIFTSRTCTLKTFKAKGVDYISELILKNVHDLAILIQNILSLGIKACIEWVKILYSLV